MTELLKISSLRMMLVVLGTFAASTAAMAQDSSGVSAGTDSLFYRDGRVEGVVISKSTQESIEFTYPGETMINEMPKSYFSQIKYHSGRVEDVEANPALASKKSSAVKVKTEKEKEPFRVWYQGDVNVGFALCLKANVKGEKLKTNLCRPLITTTHGVRITKYAFVGLGVGFQYAYGPLVDVGTTYHMHDTSWSAYMIPVFANVRGYYPVSKKFVPYISVSAGVDVMKAIDVDDWEWRRNYYYEYCVGFNVGKLDFSIGLLQQPFNLYSPNKEAITGYYKTLSYFAKIGVKF